MIGNVSIQLPDESIQNTNTSINIVPVNLYTLTYGIDYKIYTYQELCDAILEYANTYGIINPETTPIIKSPYNFDTHFIAYSDTIVNSAIAQLNSFFPNGTYDYLRQYNKYAMPMLYYAVINDGITNADYGVGECTDAAKWCVILLKCILPFCAVIFTGGSGKPPGIQSHNFVVVLTTTGNFIASGIGANEVWGQYMWGGVENPIIG